MKKITYSLYIAFILFIYLISSDLNFKDFWALESFIAPFKIITSNQLLLLFAIEALTVIFYFTIKKIKSIKGDHTFSFMEFFLIVFSIYYCGIGYINSILAQYFTPWSMGIDISLYNNLICLATIYVCYLIFYFIFPKSYPLPEQFYVIDFVKFRKSVIVLCTISIVGILAFWVFYGAIPVYSGHGIINVNMDIEEKTPILIQYGNSLIPIYALFAGIIYLINNRKDYFIFFIIVFLFALLILSGVRFPIIIAFIIAIILVFPLIKTEKKYFFQISIILLLFFVTLGVWRNRDYYKTEKDISVSAVVTIFSQLGVEFSEYARVTGVLNNPTYHPTSTAAEEVLIDNVLITSFPNVFWNLIGVDKKDHQRFTYITFGSLVYKSNFTGIRPGVYGEVYYGFGETGLIVWSILLTLFLCILDNKRIKYQDYSYKAFPNLIITLWGVILVLTVIGHFKGTTHYFTTTFLIFYSIIVYARKPFELNSQS